MTGRLRTLLALDMSAIDVRRGLLGAIVILMTAAFVAVFGMVGMTVGLAALFVIAADQPGPVHERRIGVLVITLAGSAISLVAIWAGIEHIWIAALLTFVVTAAATLTAAYSHVVAMRGLLLSMWAIIALGFAGDELNAVATALAFLLGGGAAALVLSLESRRGGAGMVAEAETVVRSIDELLRARLAWFALLRATAVAVATALGIVLFPEHSMWPALTVLLVMRPKAGEAVEAGVLRTFGTLVGVLTAEAVVKVAGGSELVILVAFILAAFATVALKNVNYWIFVLFLTTVLVLSEALAGASADAAATERLLATVLGAAIAFLGLGLGHLVLQRQKEAMPH